MSTFIEIPKRLLRHHSPLFGGVLAAGVVLVAGWALDRIANELYIEQVHAETLTKLSAVRATAEGAINKRVYLTLGLRAYVACHPDITSQEFANIAAALKREGNGIRSVTLIKDNVINDVYPRKGNENAIGLDLLKHPTQRTAALHAIKSGKPWLDGPISLVQGGEAFINRAPVYENTKAGNNSTGRYWGMVSIVFDKQTLIEDITQHRPKGLSFAIQKRSLNAKITTNLYGKPSIRDADPLNLDITLPTGSWKLIGIPHGGWPNRSPMSYVRRVATIMVAVFAGAIIWHLLRSHIRIRQSQQAALAATQAKTDFLANMSHEIRTPMNGVIGMTELVLGTNLTTDQRSCVETIQSSADSLLSVINDILDYSKIESGKMTLDLTQVSLRKTVGDVMTILAIRAQEKGLELTVFVDPGVPDQLVTDPVRLRQILLNLVGNAIKFTEQGQVSVTVSQSAMTSEELELQFQVHDLGIGIPQDRIASIFDSFSQADTSTTRLYGGTGLGLTIASQLVDILGGQISVESEVGVGSTFTFTIAARKGSPYRPNSDPPKVRVPMVDKELPVKSVLLVEDNAINRKVAERLLAKLGLTIETAENGQIALETMAARQFDLVLMDIQMPVMDGLAAVAEIRDREKRFGHHQPVIAMTANAMEGDREKYLAAGMDDYVAKPFNTDELVAAITRTFSNVKSDPPRAHLCR